MKLFLTLIFPFVFLSVHAQEGKNQHCGDHFINCISTWNAADSNSRVYSPTLFSDKAPAFYYFCMLNTEGDTVFFTRKHYQGWNGRINNRIESLSDGVYRWKAGYCMSNSRDTFSCDGELDCVGLKKLRPIAKEDTSDCVAYIPNAFTPNEDAVNDEWQPYFSCLPSEYELFIFDRWGNVVWSTTDPNRGWDGRLQNHEIAQIDVYVYKINLRFSSGDAKHSYVGHLSFIR